MNHLKKNRWNNLPFVILLILTGIVSCHFTRTTQEEQETVDTTADNMSPAPELTLNISQLDSIRVIYTADETRQANAPKSEWPLISELLESAIYDTEWNDSGIMLAMVAQDYALILAYKDQPQEENDWLLIWHDREKIKYKNKWYLVNNDIKNSLCDKIESWK